MTIFCCACRWGFCARCSDPEFSWGYFSEPEPHLDGRRVWLPRGKVLGGSGSINGMFYMRGHSRDFDTWRSLGCEGWGYRDVLPYFRRMETSWRGAGPYHGDSGPLPVRPIHTAKLLHEPLMRDRSGGRIQCHRGSARRGGGGVRPGRSQHRPPRPPRQHLMGLPAPGDGARRISPSNCTR